MNAFFKWIIVHITSLLHGISSSDLTQAIDLVTKAEEVSTKGVEKLNWFIEQFGKINSALRLVHEDGTPTNLLNLLVSLAKALAQQFGMIAPK